MPNDWTVGYWEGDWVGVVGHVDGVSVGKDVGMNDGIKGVPVGT